MMEVGDMVRINTFPERDKSQGVVVEKHSGAIVSVLWNATGSSIWDGKVFKQRAAELEVINGD